MSTLSSPVEATVSCVFSIVTVLSLSSRPDGRGNSLVFILHCNSSLSLFPARVGCPARFAYPAAPARKAVTRQSRCTASALPVTLLPRPDRDSGRYLLPMSHGARVASACVSAWLRVGCHGPWQQQWPGALHASVSSPLWHPLPG